MTQLIEVTHVSRRGSAIRVTIPTSAQEKLGAEEEDIMGLCGEKGNVILRKIN